MNRFPASIRRVAWIALIGLIVGPGCTLSLIQFPSSSNPNPTAAAVSALPSPTPPPKAQTTFIAYLPEPLAPGETLLLSVLDEVTGLSLNPTYYQMQPRDAQTYTAVLPLTFNSIVKYRYVRNSNTQTPEDMGNGAPVRYRVYYVNGPGEAKDIINDWADRAYNRASGTIQGYALNADTGTPISNLLICAGGAQTFTNSSGRFEIKGLTPGTHTLTAYAMDGAYQTFQQGASIAQGQTTSVELRIRATPMVSVTFVASAPADTVVGAPIRLAGNILQLGNSFADLAGGLSVSTDRMPIMILLPDGRYGTTINLPVGAYIQYKYTLGDGFWNAEHGASGEFIVREFIVPAQAITINDAVATWSAGSSSPILFEATVPSITPPGDIIYIQFHPYGWTEPIPMWPMGNNQWAYKLYGPFNMIGSIKYRYCRNGQCGSADDKSTMGDSAIGREVATSLSPQDIQDTVSAWAWYENPEPASIVGAAITPRASGFFAGVEFQPTFRPNWSYYMPQALVNAQALGANQITIPVTWTYSSVSPLELKPIPGTDPMWIDSAITISQARALNLNVAVFPIPHFPASSSDLAPAANFWSSAPRDGTWWQTWFDLYRTFALQSADLAAQTGSSTLILGGDWIAPALPGGALADGASSGVPADAETRWKNIIAEARQHFGGKIFWALPYTPGKLQTSPDFLKNVDGIYMLWSAPLTTQSNPNKADLMSEAGRLLDNEVSPLFSLLNKPIIIALSYPSTYGAATGCVPAPAGGCMEFSALSRPNEDIASAVINLQAQADIYEAMLTAINTRPWVAGVVSRGYYPPVALQDKSTSTHGKPTADILWYWYPRMLGTVK